MKRTRTIMGLFVAVFLLAVSIHVLHASGQAEAVTSPSVAAKDQKLLAVNIVRLINTAEWSSRAKYGKINENKKFRSWDELRHGPCFKQAQCQALFTNFDVSSLSAGPEIVPGLELRLVVSPDGMHYNLWLGQKKDIGCGFAYYSDERGVIYEGKAIGCEAPQPAPLALDTRVVRAKVTLGDFHSHRGEWDEAIAAYEEGLKLDPANAELRQKLDEVIKECEKENALLNAGFTCGGRRPIVTLIPSGDFARWNAPVRKGQIVPDNAIEGGLNPINLKMPPVVDAPAGAYIVLIINIDPNGNVTPIRMTPSDYGLGPQVTAAARGWKFEPPTLQGKPVSTMITVKVTF